MPEPLPDTIRDERHLEELLAEPTPAAVGAMSRLDGDVLVLGAGGKMGPSMLRMLRRASQAAGVERRIFAVSRFSDAALADQLESEGFEVIRGDLLDEAFVESLPDAAHVLGMTGRKFGTGGTAAATWATNVVLPATICRRYAGRRILSFSTGNVYPFVPVASGGCGETDALDPVGEYGMAALGRERVYEFYSRRDGTAVSLVRLNYAVEMRYGVLVDLATRVRNREPIDLSMGYANVIWQADANAAAIAALADAASPPFVVNVTGPELVGVRDVCERFGAAFDVEPAFTGEPAPTALLNDASLSHRRYGPPRVDLDRLVRWITDWLQRDQPTWNKATHFEVRDGRF
jgi:hypothetical protein